MKQEMNTNLLSLSWRRVKQVSMIVGVKLNKKLDQMLSKKIYLAEVLKVREASNILTLIDKLKCLKIVNASKNRK
jgi:hypothetical protein